MTGRARSLAALVSLCLGLLATGACDSDRRAYSREDLPAVPSEPTVEVELGDDGFSEDEIEVTTSDLVEFRNTSDEDRRVRTDDFAIDTGPVFPDEATYVVFDEPGRYVLVDDEGAGDELVVQAIEVADG